MKNDAPVQKDFVKKEDFRILNDYDLSGETDPTTGFPVMNICDDDKPAYHPFYDIIYTLKHDPRNDMITNANNCDTIFSRFLFSIAQIVNEKFYLVMGILLRNLRECLNEHGYDVIEEFFITNYPEENHHMIPKKKENRYFTEEENPEYLPLISDKFILEYLPKYCPDFDQ